MPDYSLPRKGSIVYFNARPRDLWRIIKYCPVHAHLLQVNHLDEAVPRAPTWACPIPDFHDLFEWADHDRNKDRPLVTRSYDPALPIFSCELERAQASLRAKRDGRPWPRSPVLQALLMQYDHALSLPTDGSSDPPFGPHKNGYAQYIAAAKLRVAATRYSLDLRFELEPDGSRVHFKAYDLLEDEDIPPYERRPMHDFHKRVVPDKQHQLQSQPPSSQPPSPAPTSPRDGSSRPSPQPSPSPAEPSASSATTAPPTPSSDSAVASAASPPASAPWSPPPPATASSSSTSAPPARPSSPSSPPATTAPASSTASPPPSDRPGPRHVTSITWRPGFPPPPSNPDEPGPAF